MMNRREYEKLNRRVFSDAEWARILANEPSDGTPIATQNGFELALWRLPNGAQHVCLKDDSQATWDAYADFLKSQLVGHAPNIERLNSPVHCGDWHDKPLKWNVRWGSKNQMFATKKEAEQYARIWRKVGFKKEMDAINEFVRRA